MYFNMKKIKWVFMTFLLVACTEGGKPREVMIRVQNLSSYDYENVVVSSGGPEYHFGNIPANMTSDYILFESAYSYAYVKVEIEGETLTLQPIDYVGESYLNSGSYTFQVDVTGSGTDPGSLTNVLRKD